jgi:hypothetical protein
MKDKELGILVLRAVICVGIEDELGAWRAPVTYRPVISFMLSKKRLGARRTNGFSDDE